MALKTKRGFDVVAHRWRIAFIVIALLNAIVDLWFHDINGMITWVLAGSWCLAYTASEASK